MKRRMVSIKMLQHISNEDLRCCSGVKDIVEMMYARKHTWAGHVARMNDNRWTKQTVECCPRNVRRKPGRPSLRWRNSLVHLHGITWVDKRKIELDGRMVARCLNGELIDESTPAESVRK
ncbi:unnamed protein product [Toxocara canis]|uniref:Uncharacterized protein n=1 Tax=Toxocara canis TaxID=6265 RepID=A0A183U4S8_TOXCA|nr:unnamed protein product [Toxocara canis]